MPSRCPHPLHSVSTRPRQRDRDCAAVRRVALAHDQTAAPELFQLAAQGRLVNAERRSEIADALRSTVTEARQDRVMRRIQRQAGALSKALPNPRQIPEADDESQTTLDLANGTVSLDSLHERDSSAYLYGPCK